MRGHTTTNGLADTFHCPNCGSTRVETQIVNDSFEYGTGPKAVKLEADVPFRKCLDCGFEYTDSEAEDIQHEAVCRHLRLLTPSEIVAVRTHFGPTRAEFAEKSRIGEASLPRWETGQLFQNAANDNYIYLLAFSDNWERLRVRQHGLPLEFRREARAAALVTRSFRCLDDASVNRKRQEARGFLRPGIG